RFEVVYAGGVPAWSLWARVEAPAPALPVPPTTFRRSWRLPPGVRPLGDRRQLRVPGPGEGFGPADGERRPADLFRLAGSPAHLWAAPAGAGGPGQGPAPPPGRPPGGRAGPGGALTARGGPPRGGARPGGGPPGAGGGGGGAPGRPGGGGGGPAGPPGPCPGRSGGWWSCSRPPRCY